MNNHGGFKNGRDRGSSLFSYIGGRRDDGSTDGLSADRFAGLVNSTESTPAASTITADAQQAEVQAEAEAEVAERAKAATEAADESAQSAWAVTVPDVPKDEWRTTPAPKNEWRSTAEVGDAGAAGVGSAAAVLALAQKLHDEHVAAGQNIREKLIREGQLRHDQVVGQATARQEELVSIGQAKHDEFVSVGEAKHDALIAGAEALVAEANAEHEHMITEARERSTGMVAEAQQKRAEVLQGLVSERSALQKEIEELQTFERDHRARLKSYLEGQLNEVEQTGDDETGL